MNDRHVTPELNEAWDALCDVLPARWHVGKPTYDPRNMAWSVTAWGPVSGRRQAPPGVSGTGEDEAAALRDLNDRLRGVPKPNTARMDQLRRQLPMEYLDGAESVSRDNVGRGLTGDELGRMIERSVGQ
jgi:hypothetical protein